MNANKDLVVSKCVSSKRYATWAVIKLITFYENTPLNKRDAHIAGQIKRWAEKGNEINDEFFSFAQEICEEYGDFVYEIWVMETERRNKNKAALEAAKQSVEESGYGTLD